MIDGVSLKLGGEDFVVPPLRLKDLRRLKDGLAGLVMLSRETLPIPNDEQFETMIDIVHSALRRNYPDLTKEKVEDIVDLRNVSTIFEAIMKSSGLEKVTIAAGEAVRPSGLTSSTGRTSTGDSAPT